MLRKEKSPTFHHFMKIITSSLGRSSGLRGPKFISLILDSNLKLVHSIEINMLGDTIFDPSGDYICKVNM